MYVTGLGVQDVYTEGYVNVIGSDVKVTAYPQVVHVDLSSVGTNPTVDYMAEDQSGNTAVCRIQLRIEGRSFLSKNSPFETVLHSKGLHIASGKAMIVALVLDILFAFFASLHTLWILIMSPQLQR